MQIDSVLLLGRVGEPRADEFLDSVMLLLLRFKVRALTGGMITKGPIASHRLPR